MSLEIVFSSQIEGINIYFPLVDFNFFWKYWSFNINLKVEKTYNAFDSNNYDFGANI